jgi:hypothetical protein
MPRLVQMQSMSSPQAGQHITAASFAKSVRMYSSLADISPSSCMTGQVISFPPPHHVHTTLPTAATQGLCKPENRSYGEFLFSLILLGGAEMSG